MYIYHLKHCTLNTAWRPGESAGQGKPFSARVEEMHALVVGICSAMMSRPSWMPYTSPCGGAVTLQRLVAPFMQDGWLNVCEPCTAYIMRAYSLSLQARVPSNSFVSLPIPSFLLRESREHASMDPAASAVGIARSGTQICKELLTYLVMWKSFHGVCDSVAD